MHEVISFDTYEPEDGVSHYFEVELHNVTRTKNDILLNQIAVAEYLSEIGPVPFSPRFRYGRKISAFLKRHDAGPASAIHVNDVEALVRPFLNTFTAKLTLFDKFTRVEFLEIPGLTEGFDAVGWLLHHGYHGALPSRSGIAGLRLRAGNIQLGDASLLQAVFPEPRFNYWSVGEIHLLSSRLVPNGRRDELESSIQQQNLLNHASLHAKRLTRLCRSYSTERNSAIPVAETDISAARNVGEDAAERWLLQNKCDHHLSYLNIHRRQVYRAVLTSLLRASQNVATVQQVIADALPKFREVES
jgi:molecular chaperone HtpG